MHKSSLAVDVSTSLHTKLAISKERIVHLFSTDFFNSFQKKCATFLFHSSLGVLRILLERTFLISIKPRETFAANCVPGKRNLSSDKLSCQVQALWEDLC